MNTGRRKRYTMYYSSGNPPRAELSAILETPGVTVIDHEIERAMLIEADEATVETLREKFPDWKISPETFYPRPEPQ